MRSVRRIIGLWTYYVSLVGPLLISAHITSAAPVPQVSVAVLETAPSLSALGSLLTVQLSQRGLVLIERSALDQILREQKLGAAGLLERGTSVKVGRLARADAFLLLSREAIQRDGRGALLGVRLVETARGIRLLDCFESFHEDRIEESAEHIASKVERAAEKLRMPEGQLTPVGVVDVHRVELGEECQWVARAVRGILAARLGREPRLLVLEREDLKILQEERALTDGPKAAFWRSAVLIDGYLRKGKKPAGKATGSGRHMTLELKLRQPAGEEIATLSAPLNEDTLRADLERVLIQVPAKLKVRPVSPGSVETEATEFFRQGCLLRDHQRYADAVSLFETAWALQPRNVGFGKELFLNEWGSRSYLKKSIYSDRELAELVSRIVRRLRDADKVRADSLRRTILWPSRFDDTFFLEGYFTSAASVADEEVGALNRENRSIWTNLVQQEWQRRHRGRYDKGGHELRRVVLARANTADEALTGFRELVTKLVLPPALGGAIRSFDQRHYFCGMLLLSHVPPRSGHLKEEQERLTNGRLDCLRELAESKDPLARFVAYLALVNHRARTGQLPPGGSVESAGYCDQALRLLQHELKASGSEQTRQALRDGLKSCLTMAYGVAGKDRVVAKFEEILEPLLTRKDAAELARWQPGRRISANYLLHGPGAPYAELAKRYVALLERTAAVLQTQADRKEVRAALNQVKDRAAEIRERFPEIGQPEGASGPSVRMLLSRSDWPWKWPRRHGGQVVCRPVLRDSVLWVASIKDYQHRPKISLAGIDLTQKKVIALWQRQPVGWRSLERPQVQVAMAPGCRYLSVEGLGLTELPGATEQGSLRLRTRRVLGKSEGLPSTHITGIAAQGKHLWVAYGGRKQESGLGRYDPATGEWQSVFCSTLKGGAPFSAGEPYRLRELALHTDTLFFVLDDVSVNRRFRGLWRLSTETRKPEFVHRLANYQELLGQIVDCGTPWRFKSPHSLVQFDPVAATATLLLGRPGTLKNARPRLSLKRDQFVPRPYEQKLQFGQYLFNKLDLSTAAVHDGKLWARSGKSQLVVIARGSRPEDALRLDNNILDGNEALHFLSTPGGLLALGDGCVGLIETKTDGGTGAKR